jgi:hypothetical protein
MGLVNSPLSVRFRVTPERVAACLAGLRFASSRFVRLAAPVLCKVALLLMMVQAPEADTVEGAKKVAEECVLAEGHPATRPRSQSVLRRDASHLVRRSPVQFLPRIGRGEHARGHLLANGLLAPLRC